MNILKKLLNPYRGLRREIYVLFISRTINAMGMLIFPFMTLLLSSKIGLNGAQTGFYVTLTGLFYAPAGLIGGKLSDSFGRKKILITFEILATACYFLCLLIEPSLLMVYILMAASFFFGAAGPSHDALTADLTTPEQREGAYSLIYLGFNLGFGIAQIIAGFLFKDHLKLMFLIDGFTAIVGILLIAFFIKETVFDHKKTELKEEQKPSQSIFSVILARPVLIFFAIAAFGYKFVYSQWPFLMPLHAEFNFPGEGAKLFGMLGTFNAVTVLIFTPILTAMFSKKSNIRRVFYAGLLFTIGFGMLGFISFKAAFFLSVFIFTLGEILEAVSTPPFIMNQTPATHRGRMSSVIPLIMGSGYTVGPVVMGMVLYNTSFQFSWMVAGTVVLISTIAMKGIDVVMIWKEKKKTLQVGRAV
ncbi:MAG: MFS transporter [Spirochaetaceae bacterium]|jgi:MFS family permease|nr:MFS transporter [Spirochaetaceae bacterium]